MSPKPQVGRPLPTKTVTFLLTDIEGSTQLWEQSPQAMQAALADHDESLRHAIESSNGVLFKTTGDGVYAAFAVATDALAACLAAQLVLQSAETKASDDHPASCPSDVPAPLRVRMGLHTGVAELRGGDYFGSALNRAARIMSAAHGGQVLLSAATAELVRGQLPEATTLLDVGEHRLKGVLNAERLFQIVAPALRADFPPLRSLNVEATNLPLQASSFIGRGTEQADIIGLLSSHRLVTLTGAGGIGKTRLSIAIGTELLTQYSDGVWFVNLASLADPALVSQSVAMVLGLRATQGRLDLTMLTGHLHDKRLLLILDNCEHLVQACAQFADAILHTCPQVRVLATSREPLGIAGEISRRVSSMQTPGASPHVAATQVAGFEAVRLFTDRARAVRSNFHLTDENAPAVVQICQRLDGIPLALELAAARVKMFSVEQIASRLDDCFLLLTDGSRTAMPRHQTLHSLIDWSHTLLSEREQILLRRLSVFAGGWSFEAAQAVCTGDGIGENAVLDLLGQLVDKSLVTVAEHEGQSRYRLLETIRQYAHEKLLESGERDRVGQQHMDFYVTWTETLEPEFVGNEQTVWLKRLDPELDNLRATLAWSIATRAIRSGSRLLSATYRFWWLRGQSREVIQRLTEFLNQPEFAAHTMERARALYAAGFLENWVHSNFSDARPLLEESFAIANDLGDNKYAVRAQMQLGVAAQYQGDHQTARSLFAMGKALALAKNDVFAVRNILSFEADDAYMQGEYERAKSLNEACIAHRKTREGHDLAYLLRRLGQCCLRLGHAGEAVGFIRESLMLNWDLGDRQGVAACMAALAAVAMAEGQEHKAITLFAAVDVALKNIGSQLLHFDQTVYDRNLLGVRAQLDRTSFEAAWADGQTLSIEQAIEFAMNEPLSEP
jgi:predicted ATPase/class 3 adenylate cyclase